MGDQRDSEEFWEVLPAGCPPEDAVPPAATTVIRLAKQSQPTSAHFASHASRGLPIKGPVTCSYASCSMFYHDDKREQLNAMRRLPRFKSFKYAFLVSIDASSGLGLAGHAKHLDLWMYKSFDPVAAVVSVEEMHG